MLGFRAGLNMDLGGGSRFEASGALRLDKMEDLLTQSTTSGTSTFGMAATEIQIIARLRLKISNRVAFVPYGAFLTVSADPKEDQTPVGVTTTTLSVKNSITVIAIGAGAEYKVSNFYLAGGVSFNSNASKQEASAPPAPGTTTNTITVTGFPVFNLGTEWWFVDWLAGESRVLSVIPKHDTKSESTLPGCTNHGVERVRWQQRERPYRRLCG